MSSSSPWYQPSVIVSIGSLAVGISGFLFGVVSSIWNRRESRLEALGKILEPMVKAAQKLHAANDCRKKSELLKVSFPNPASAPEAVERVNSMIGEYGEMIKASQEAFREAEAKLSATSFRFPDRIATMTRDTLTQLSEFGRFVNEGMFDKADLEFARFKDKYAAIRQVGRGWRLLDPIEGVRKYFTKKVPEPQKTEDLSPDEMNIVMDLIHKRATTQRENTFAVHPPQKLIDNPQIATSDSVIDELSDSVFVVAFQDGVSQMLTLPQLLAFVYNLIVLEQTHNEVGRMMQAANPPNERIIKVNYQFSVTDIMRPEMAKAILSKVAFSTHASDSPQESTPATP